MKATSAPRIVLLGGGTGSFTLLQGLKKLTPNITAIVNMSDDGGSTGTLRDELGVLPPGDVRQCLVALSDSPVVRNLFNYRFSKGRFEGQSMGNIILSGLELQHDSFEEAIKVAGEILQITGTVLPVTLEKHTLVMKDGEEIIRGEWRVANHPIHHRDAEVWLEPKASLNPDAGHAIRAADMVIIAPGSLYGSLLPLLSVHGMSDALQATKARVVCIANLVNKPHQNKDWHVADYIARYEQAIGEGVIDAVLYNDQEISQELLKAYAEEGDFPVHTDEARFQELKAQAIGLPLVSQEIAAQDPADTAIRRTLIRHDAERVCAELKQILAHGLK